MNDEISQYKSDAYGSVYEYSDEEDAYVFIGKLNGKTLEGFLKDRYWRTS